MDKNIKIKAQEILNKLTLDEKIGMIHGAQLFETAGVQRLNIPPLKMSDGPMGVRQEFKPSSWQTVGLSDDYVTYLPCNSAIASTWNRNIAYETGSVLGEEARGRGKDVILAPGVNIKRSPLCGRNFEYFSEDPYLTKELAVEFIKGVQNWDVTACVKHFAANNQETQRLWVDVQIDEKALREIYLPAFYAAIKDANCHTIMGAYNLLNGEHCCQSEYLLNDILRKEWGYDGVVISDWGAVHDTELAGKSQLDIEMSVTDNFDEYFMAEPLKKKIQNGEISESYVNEKVLHILMLMIKLHMFDKNRKSGTYNTPEHRQKALLAARESVILLKNDNNILPLDKNDIDKILIIGENAECTHSNGGGSAEIKALYEITPLMGIKTLLGGNVQVDYVQGYSRDNKKKDTDTNWQETSLENGGGQTSSEQAIDNDLILKRENLRKKAVNLAKEYKNVIFIGGLNHEHDSEGNDRENMILPYEQDLLISELLDVNPNTVISFVGGSPVEIHRWIDKTNAVVWSWYAGMEGGRALAEVLFGDVNPSGKLPETFYKKHTDCSAHSLGQFPGDDKVKYNESIFVGYRYNDTFNVEPQFCFGHGLSYTSFAYSEPSVKFENNNTVVSCTIENTGCYDGQEIVQVYLSPKMHDKSEPLQQLKGFEKIYLKAGEKKNISIMVSDYKPNMYIRIGSSSKDIRLEIK